jgi:flagellar protein FliO/FliZ
MTLGWIDLLQHLLSFLLVIGLMLGLLWALKRLQGGALMQRKHQRLQVLETLSLGPRQKLALVRVDGQQMLVGVTAGQINALGPWQAVPVDQSAAAVVVEGQP